MVDNVFRRFGPHLSSKPVRYGCILYSLHRNAVASHDERHMVYLDQFYKAVREAIDRNAFADIVYGCYAGCLYSLRVNKPFKEIVQHAEGFRTSVGFLTPSSGPVCEETFFLECLWEKLVWVMTRALLKTTASVESWNILAEFAQPLGLSDYNDQPKWVHEALADIKLKLQFIRFVVALTLDGSSTAIAVKMALWRRFLPWVKKPPDGRGNTGSHCNRFLLHNLSRNLWSELLTLLSSLMIAPLAHVSEINLNLSFISTIVDCIPISNPASPSTEFQDLNEMSIISLVLVGMVASQLGLDLFGLSVQYQHANQDSSHTSPPCELPVQFNDLRRAGFYVLLRSVMCTAFSMAAAMRQEWSGLRMDFSLQLRKQPSVC